MSLYYRILSRAYRRAARKMCQEAAKFIQKGSKILDIGCGSGIIAKNFQEFFQAELIGIDIQDKRIFPINFQIINSYHYPFPDNSFDTVLINYVLHHSDDPAALLNEAKRVAKDKIIIYEDLPEGFVSRLFCKIHGKVFDKFFENPSKTSFTTEKQWEEVFEKIKLNVIFKKRIINFPVKQNLFVLKK